jgi:Family of unknown function (DUF6416)
VDTEDITVKVPTARVPEFYEMYGRWLARPMRAQATGEPTRPWQKGDDELATEVWSRLSDRAKAVFGLLMQEPGRRHRADVIAESLGIPNGHFGVAGSLAWPGRHAAAVGRQLPVSWEENNDGYSVYWMDEPAASLFRAARADSPENETAGGYR